MGLATDEALVVIAKALKRIDKTLEKIEEDLHKMESSRRLKPEENDESNT